MPTIPTAPPQPTSVRNYSEYLARLSGMIGLPVTNMTADELTFLNAYFNNNVRAVWTYANWLDVCPMGEARFINNSLSYSNDLTQFPWSAGQATLTSGVLANPLDGRVNVSRLLETTGSISHFTTQTIATPMAPGATYTCSVFARAIGGRWLRMICNDGTTSHTGFFNLATGVVGTITTGDTSNITPVANGFYFCQISFTASTSTTTASQGVSLSTSLTGTSATFVGDPTAGLYLYGAVLQQTSNLADSANLLPWIQAGEPEIDTFYMAWRNAPFSANSPNKIGYSVTNTGLQFISSSWNNGYLLTPTSTTLNISATAIGNPIYIYYRWASFSYFGSAFSSTSTYAIGDIVQFTTSAGIINYYTCIVATTAGQSPTTTPSSWSLNYIPDVFFQYVCYKSYADWLRMDGQFDKANAQEGLAQTMLENEFDTQEREMGVSAPLRVQTHLTSR